MRRGERTRTLKTLVEVRSVQRLGAEMALARADAALRRETAERDAAVERLAEDYGRWTQAVEGPSMGLSVARSWSANLLTGEEALKAKQAQVAQASAEREDRADTCRAAEARHDVVEDILRRSTRRDARLRDEAAQADLADRSAQRARRPS